MQKSKWGRKKAAQRNWFSEQKPFFPGFRNNRTQAVMGFKMANSDHGKYLNKTMKEM